MNLLIVTDIFGKTPALDALAGSLAGADVTVEIMDPYDDNYREFATEGEAYRVFQKERGLESYILLLQQKIKDSHSKKLLLLGFSVGASAIWAASPSIPGKVSKAICFYSSQIRNYLGIQPNIQIDLYFAKSEPMYDVGNVATYLKTKKNVACIETEYMHGFMNRHSVNFNQDAYDNYLELLNISIDKNLSNGEEK